MLNFNTSDASIIRKTAGDLSFSVDEGSKLVRIKKISWHPDVKVLFQTNEWVARNVKVD